MVSLRDELGKLLAAASTEAPSAAQSQAEVPEVVPEVVGAALAAVKEARMVRKSGGFAGSSWGSNKSKSLFSPLSPPPSHSHSHSPSPPLPPPSPSPPPPSPSPSLEPFPFPFPALAPEGEGQQGTAAEGARDKIVRAVEGYLRGSLQKRRELLQSILFMPAISSLQPRPVPDDLSSGATGGGAGGGAGGIGAGGIGAGGIGAGGSGPGGIGAGGIGAGGSGPGGSGAGGIGAGGSGAGGSGAGGSGAGGSGAGAIGAGGIGAGSIGAGGSGAGGVGFSPSPVLTELEVDSVSLQIFSGWAVLMVSEIKSNSQGRCKCGRHTRAKDHFYRLPDAQAGHATGTCVVMQGQCKGTYQLICGFCLQVKSIRVQACVHTLCTTLPCRRDHRSASAPAVGNDPAVRLPHPVRAGGVVPAAAAQGCEGARDGGVGRQRRQGAEVRGAAARLRPQPDDGRGHGVRYGQALNRRAEC